MKKGITMLLVLALSAMMLVGCGGGGIAGTYKMTKAEVNGKEMELDALAEMMGQKFEATITLKDDGTVEMVSSMLGQETKESGTWKEDGDKVVINNKNGSEEQSLTLEDGKLYMDGGNGIKVILEK